jgi:hypothetical protein
MFNSEVSDAAASIELIRRGDGLGRANIKTAVTGSAVVFFRSIRL